MIEVTLKNGEDPAELLLQQRDEDIELWVQGPNGAEWALGKIVFLEGKCPHCGLRHWQAFDVDGRVLLPRLRDDVQQLDGLAVSDTNARLYAEVFIGHRKTYDLVFKVSMTGFELGRGPISSCDRPRTLQEVTEV